jgi:uncharacterized membrane protein YjjP (DUF1212 family)
MTCREILPISMQIGRGLLESGAEAYRVENSVHHVIEAYGLGEVQVFSIPNCLHISLTANDGTSYAKMCRASSLKSVDLEKLNALNDLCRAIAEEKPEAEEIWARLRAIDHTRQYSLLMQMLSYAVGSAAFALFWGGVWLDGVAAAIVGCAVAVAMYVMGRLEANLFYKSIIASALCALLASLFVGIGLGYHLDDIIIGVFMTLLPGVMITNFMREIIVGDWLTGITKLAEALLIATGIALGTGIILALL